MVYYAQVTGWELRRASMLAKVSLKIFHFISFHLAFNKEQNKTQPSKALIFLSKYMIAVDFYSSVVDE